MKYKCSVCEYTSVNKQDVIRHFNKKIKYEKCDDQYDQYPDYYCYGFFSADHFIFNLIDLIIEFRIQQII